MDKVQRPNRDGAFRHLEHLDRGVFKLCGDFQYISITSENNEIKAVDPDGGPFIAVGDTVDGMEIESIQDDGENIFIYVKEK